MYNSFQLAFKYLHYYRTAANSAGHGIHSPFVYEFVRAVLKEKQKDASFEKIENLRKELLRDQTLINVKDYGAGSAMNNGLQRRVADVARHAAKRPVIAQLLFRIARYFQPDSIIELGTSLGISAAYLAAAVPPATVVSIEGSELIAELARKNLQQLHAANVQVISGTFDEKLPGILSNFKKIDCVFIDGNHGKEPTLRYFNLFLPHLSESGFLIFDDIHWSRDMEAAWEMIKQHPQVTCTMDLFFIGLVFFRREIKVPQHFIIRYPYFWR